MDPEIIEDMVKRIVGCIHRSLVVWQAQAAAAAAPFADRHAIDDVLLEAAIGSEVPTGAISVVGAPTTGSPHPTARCPSNVVHAHLGRRPRPTGAASHISRDAIHGFVDLPPFATPTIGCVVGTAVAFGVNPPWGVVSALGCRRSRYRSDLDLFASPHCGQDDLPLVLAPHGFRLGLFGGKAGRADGPQEEEEEEGDAVRTHCH
mmetsp:Transcript_61925/g.147715  ORF Transcript_61925/g.147715 Transcript_61925/m.147715 type:complete len:204 (-) Transcript_61925:154-765(-)